MLMLVAFESTETDTLALQRAVGDAYSRALSPSCGAVSETTDFPPHISAYFLCVNGYTCIYRVDTSVASGVTVFRRKIWLYSTKTVKCWVRQSLAGDRSSGDAKNSPL